MFLCSYSCLHIHGPLRNLLKDPSMDYLMTTYPPFLVFTYYTHDIEDGIDAIKGCWGLGGSDFFVYNLLLLWLLPPLSSTTIKLLILFGLSINVQIGLVLTDCSRSLYEVCRMPGLPLPVIFVSTYALIIDCIM